MPEYTSRQRQSKEDFDAAMALKNADTADHLLFEYERLQKEQPERLVKVPPNGRYGVIYGRPPAILIEVTDPLFGSWGPGAKMLSVYSEQGFEDTYGRVHQSRAFAVLDGGRYIVFKKVRDLIAAGGDGPESKPLRLAVDGARAMITEGDWLKYAKEFGKATGKCCICHRRLTDPQSVFAGIGPDCAKRFE